MKTINPSIFKAFQNSDEYFEMLSDNGNSKQIILQQVVLILVFTFLYGIIMGSYNGWLQSIVTGIKLPVLILLSLLICFPALYVIQSMIGSTMTIYQMAKIIFSGFFVFSTIALSFGPIIIFFMITSNSYSFLKLLHVAIFVFSGIFAVKTIVSGLKFSCEKKNLYPKLGLTIFKIWVFILAFVSSQLAWNLRPFVGSRELQFELFREKEGNFFIAVINSVGHIVSPGKDMDQDKPDEEIEKAGILK
ncbi:MAG TPA: hypothetical protein VK155_09880 [Bacteroidales bacterium]|jgi:hypothetical protein|nr:hypothetical protein [Bacteroidales bacterium]